MELESIEIVEDRTAQARCDEGFLRLRRLVLRNHYTDGKTSAAYPCDVVRRRDTDAVAVALYELREEGERRRIYVALRRGIRAPIYLRKDMDRRGRDEPIHTSIHELVAGVIEGQDQGMEGVRVRAMEEAREEAGLAIAPDAVQLLGGPFFPSPGITPEMVYLARCEASIEERGEAEGDGSVMEEGASVEVFELREAIARCRRGEIGDAKTEIGLLRLADDLGYLPQLDRFIDELPAELRAGYHKLGLG